MRNMNTTVSKEAGRMWARTGSSSTWLRAVAPKAERNFDGGVKAMKRCAAATALVLGMSFPVWADDQSPEKSRQALLPRLSAIMVATQLQHFKLWYAGRVGNWDLANYQLAQIRATFADAGKFYPN